MKIKDHKKFENIKIISFDLDGTLVDKDTFDKIFWHKVLPRLYAKKHKISIKKAEELVTKEYYKAPQSHPNWYRPKHWFKFFDLKEDHEQVLEGMKEKIKVYKDVIPTLKKLHKKQKMIVITHSTRDFLKFKMEVENLKQYFDKIISTTDDLEAIKKDEKIYKLILKKLKIKPEEMLHVGDNKVFDFEVPRKIGINALFVDRSEKTKGKFVIKSLEQVMNFI